MSRARPATYLYAVLSAGVGIACTTPSPPHGAAIGTPPAPSPSVRASAEPGHLELAASASADPSPSASAAPQPRLPARPTTPGKIACETVDCDLASEVCCVIPLGDDTTIGKCAPKPTESGPASPCCPGAGCGNPGITVERRCDEAADCGPGTLCRDLDAGEGDFEQQFCDVHPAVEVCLTGSTCRNGNRCVSEHGSSVGHCPLQIMPPACDATICKYGEACCWNLENDRGHCAVECDEGDARYECTSPEQCDHSACDSLPGAGVYDCGGGGFQAGVLCRTVKDCPAHLSADPSLRLRACKHTKGMPKIAKECVYE